MSARLLILLSLVRVVCGEKYGGVIDDRDIYYFTEYIDGVGFGQGAYDYMDQTPVSFTATFTKFSYDPELIDIHALWWKNSSKNSTTATTSPGYISTGNSSLYLTSVPIALGGFSPSASDELTVSVHGIKAVDGNFATTNPSKLLYYGTNSRGWLFIVSHGRQHLYPWHSR